MSEEQQIASKEVSRPEKDDESPSNKVSDDKASIVAADLDQGTANESLALSQQQEPAESSDNKEHRDGGGAVLAEEQGEKNTAAPDEGENAERGEDEAALEPSKISATEEKNEEAMQGTAEPCSNNNNDHRALDSAASEITANSSTVNESPEVLNEGYLPDISRQTSFAVSEDASTSVPAAAMEEAVPETLENLQVAWSEPDDVVVSVPKTPPPSQAPDKEADAVVCVDNNDVPFANDRVEDALSPPTDRTSIPAIQESPTVVEDSAADATTDMVRNDDSPIHHHAASHKTASIPTTADAALTTTLLPLQDNGDDDDNDDTHNNNDTKQRANTDDFVNHGLALWETRRQDWLDHHHSASQQPPLSLQQRRATPLEVDDIIDVIFTSSRQVREQGGPRKFAKNVPLPQMVDILQDLWEAEGLDA